MPLVLCFSTHSHKRPAGHQSLKCENKLMGTVVSVALHEKLSETFESQIDEICSNTIRIIKEQLEAHSDKIAEELKQLVDIREELLTKSESTSSTTPLQVLSDFLVSLTTTGRVLHAFCSKEGPMPPLGFAKGGGHFQTKGGILNFSK